MKKEEKELLLSLPEKILAGDPVALLVEVRTLSKIHVKILYLLLIKYTDMVLKSLTKTQEDYFIRFIRDNIRVNKEATSSILYKNAPDIQKRLLSLFRYKLKADENFLEKSSGLVCKRFLEEKHLISINSNIKYPDSLKTIISQK